MSDDIDRAELRRLHAAATPGPWRFNDSADTRGSKGEFRAPSPHNGFMLVGPWTNDADIELMLAARTAVPALLDALEAADHRATRAEAKAEVRKRQVAYWREETQKARDRARALEG